MITAIINMQYCWAHDDSRFPEWHGPYATRDEAHVAACEHLADCCEPGTVTRYQTAVVRRADFYLHEYEDGVADVVVEALEGLIGEEWGWEEPPIDLSLRFELIRSHKVLEAAYRDTLAKIVEGTGIKPLLGSPE